MANVYGVQPGAEYEYNTNLMYGFISVKSYNYIYDKKISSKIILKVSDRFKGKTVWEKFSNMKDEDFNPSMFDMNTSVLYKCDSVDKKTHELFEVKKREPHKDYFLMTDPFGIKRPREVMPHIERYLGTIDNYNRIIRLIHEKCGDFICEQITNKMIEMNVTVTSDSQLKIGEDYYLKSQITNSRNPDSLGDIRWEIIGLLVDTSNVIKYKKRKEKIEDKPIFTEIKSLFSETEEIDEFWLT